MEKYYDGIAEGYEELHKEEQEAKIRFIKPYLHVKKSDKLLDVGCGTGISTEPWDCERVGIDPSQKLIDIGRKLRPEIKFHHGYAESLPFPDNYFDVVISLTAVQNFKDIKKGLEEIKRVGKRKYVLSFLKGVNGREDITEMIEKTFEDVSVLEEEKDLFFIVG